MLYDDGVIDPRDTRTVLGICLSVIDNKPYRRHRPVRGVPAVITRSRLLVANRAEIASPGLPHLPRARHRDRRRPLRRRRRRCRTSREADVAVRLPGNAPGRDLPRRRPVLRRRAGGPAPTRSTRATASCPRTPTSPARSIGAGLTWVGPTPESIDAMGSKIEAKELMGRPASRSCEAPGRADRGRPPAAGQGVRRRRWPRHADRPRPRRPAGEIAAAEAEAASAFGDGTVFVEPYVERGRHVEVQVVGDGHGDVLVLGERDCSHPAPAPEGGRGGAGARARRRGPRPRCTTRRRKAAAGDRLPRRRHGRVPLRPGDRAVLVPGDEHPAPGRAPGHRAGLRRRPGRAADRGAEGATRSTSTLRADRAATGHAIEVRLYAEDPAADYQPQSGAAHARSRSRSSDGIRVDAGFETGSEVVTHYDAMLAKVIAHAPTREQAARQLAGVLRRARIHGAVTNRDLLVAILRDDRTSWPARSAPPSSTTLDVEPSSSLDAGSAPAVAAALALAERAGEARDRPARHPGRLAQRRLAAAGHRVRATAPTRRVVRRPRRLRPSTALTVVVGEPDRA